MTIHKYTAKQNGAILIFSLVILLLVTLLGTSMVQQNRIQFLMAGNAQEKSTEFASAEDVLRLAEDYIDATRYEDPDDFICNKTAGAPPKLAQIKPGTDITGKLGLTAELKAIVNIQKTSCALIGGVEQECLVDPDDSESWGAGEINCNQNTSAFCPTEIYTIVVTLVNELGSKKEVVARYAVRCDS